MKPRLFRCNYIVFTTVFLWFWGVGSVWGQMGGFDHSFMLKGPWDLVVQTGANQSFSFPIKVAQDTKPQQLNMSYPVLGTSIKISLQEYLPDLTWAPYVEEKKGAGSVARVMIRGKDLEQERWLSTADSQRQSISSPIGRVFFDQYDDPVNFSRNLQQLADAANVGVITIKHKEQEVLREYVIKPQQTIDLSDSAYRLTVLDYFPHYSRDMKTNTDVNLSEKPVNPAIKVKVENGDKIYEKWLFARFPSFVHMDQAGQATATESLEMNYRFFNFSGAIKIFVMVVDPTGQYWLVSSDERQIQTDKLTAGKAYAFTEDYHFTVEQIWSGAELKYRWKNNTEALRRPALVISFEAGQDQQQMVLELGKPQHIKDESGTYILHFKKK